jgi:hypothetical protein
VQHGSADTYSTNRPQNNFALDGNSFKGRHELKFGFGWRKAEVDSSDVYPGNGVISNFNGYPDMIAKITRPGHFLTDAIYTSAYGGDTISWDRLTVNLGLRWDRSSASLGAATVPASPVLPNLLPSLTATSAKNAVVMNAVTPRIGVNWALDESRKTLVRGSYAMFASQLNATTAGVISAIQYSAIYYYAVDTNRNNIADPSEILFDLGNIGYYGFDPNDPSRLETINQIGDYATPMTHEVMFGGSRELATNFGIDATFTYRYFNHFNWPGNGSLIGVNSSNYNQVGTLTGSVDPVGNFSTPFYAIDPAVVPPGGGQSYEERKGYHQRYVGFEVSAVKRLSNHWQARFGFSTNDHNEYFKGADALDDPTPAPNNPRINGGEVVRQTGGSGKSNIYMVLPKYQFIANGLYQAPWGINLGANWVLRQGYAMPYFRSRVATGDVLGSNKNVLIVSDVTDNRLPSVSSLDFRLEKSINIQRARIALDLDVFNLFNNATVLGRTFDLRLTGPTGFNQVLEIMNPRILRVGARLTF